MKIKTYLFIELKTGHALRILYTEEFLAITCLEGLHRPKGKIFHKYERLTGGEGTTWRYEKNEPWLILPHQIAVCKISKVENEKE